MKNISLDGKQIKTISSIMQNNGVFIFLALLFTGNCIFTNNFFDIKTVWLLIIQSFPIIIVALGMTLVIALGGIDISVGATMAFSGTVLAHLMVNMGVPLVYCIPIALFAAAIIGAINGFVIAKFHVQPIVMTLVVMLAARGFAQVVTNGRPVPFSYLPLNDIANFRFWEYGMPIQLPLALTLALVIAFTVKRTVFGKQLQAVGDNPAAARLAGINVFLITIIVFSICALTAGFATIIEVGRESQAEAARMGIGMELNAIAAVAVGGTPLTGGRARVWGTVAGALIMQMVGMTINMHGMLSSWGMVAKALILVTAVWLQYDKEKA